MRFVTPKGVSIELASEIARGGEGYVATVRGRPDVVAKVYLQSPSHEQRRKLEVMIGAQAQHPALQNISAWPSDLLLAPSSHQLSGFLMPRLGEFKPVHLLLRTQDRRQHFPSAHWDFLLATALNVARAFLSLHRLGYVMGDVNESNLLVSPKDATVRLIDVDSFQVHDGTKTFRCDVGVPLFTPPELQGKTFSNFDRNTNHDLFGIAVLLFQLLFMGRHPFFGQFLGHGEMTPERAIAEYRFAFGSNAQALLMKRPPLTLPLAVISESAVRNFERAFSPDGVRQRPSAEEWLSALATLQTELSVCPIDAAHKFPRRATLCPWCEFENQGGPEFFVSAITTKSGTNFLCHPDELRDLLSQLNKIPTGREFSSSGTPSQAVTLPLPTGISTAANQIKRASFAALLSGSAIAAGALTAATGLSSVGFSLALVASPVLLLLLAYVGVVAFRTGVAAAWRNSQEELRLAQSSFERRTTRLTERIAAHTVTDRQLRMREVDLRGRFSSLQNDFNKSKIQLEQHREQIQRKEFLDRHPISNADIHGIGTSRTADLRRHGIVSAADVLARDVQRVSGIGPVLAAGLERWASGVQSRFRFDPRKGVSESDLVKLATRFRALKAQTLQELRAIVGAIQLEANRAQADVRLLEASRNDAYSVTTQHAAWIDELRRLLDLSLSFKWLGVLAILLVSAIPLHILGSPGSPNLETQNTPPSTSSPTAPSAVIPLSSGSSLTQDELRSERLNLGVPGILSTSCVVRATPSANSTRVGLLKRGSRVRIIGSHNGWKQISAATLSGWTGPRCWTANRANDSKTATCPEPPCKDSLVAPTKPDEATPHGAPQSGTAPP